MTRIQLSEHFYADEFVCRCGKCELSVQENIIKYINTSHVEKLEEVRMALGVPITINRGISCKEHHIDIYKRLYKEDWEKFITWNSFHLIGVDGKFHAGDYEIKGVDLYKASMTFSFFRFFGVIWYQYEISEGRLQDYFIHADTGFRNSGNHLFFDKKIYKK